jgi:hypothetical protein
MICGRYEVDWANIQLFRWWHRLGRRDIVHWPLVTTIKDRSIYFGKDLLHLLTEARFCGATDERDKLYALFPMIRNATKDGLTANYTLPREERYLKYATYLSHQSPQFLCAVSHRPGGLHSSKLPTWVPQWDFDDGCTPIWPDTGRAMLETPELTTLHHDVLHSPYKIYETRLYETGRSSREHVFSVLHGPALSPWARAHSPWIIYGFDNAFL